MDLLDTTIVHIALPAIQQSLHASTAQLQWVAASYTLSFALTLVTAGRIGDIVGRKRMVLAGIAGFVLASAVCAFAPSIAVLLLGRVLQGLTGAFVMTQGLSIFQVAFPPGERATILGLFGAVVAISTAVGPVLGGLVVEADLFGLGWRPVFLINLPVGIATLIGAALFVRESRAQRPPTLDLTGVAILTAALLALLYPLVQGRALGWPVWTYLVMLASAPLFALFVYHQRLAHRRGSTPLIQPELLRQRPFVAGLAGLLVFYAGIPSLFFVFAIYLQQALHFTALQAGLAMVAWPLATMPISIASTRLATRYGPRVLTVGAIVVAAGQVLLIASIPEAGVAVGAWHFVPAMIVGGIGLGLVAAPIVDVILARVPTTSAGSASGLLNTTEQLAAAAGVALIGTIFFGELTTADVRQQVAFAGAIQTALWVNVGLIVSSAAVTLLLPRRHASDDTLPP